MSSSIKFKAADIKEPLCPQLGILFKNECDIDIAVGFLSAAGLKNVIDMYENHECTGKFRLVCGAITSKAIDIWTSSKKVSELEIKFAFPYFTPTGSKGSKYSPMMHSKI